MSLNNGKITFDSEDAVLFFQGKIIDPHAGTYGFMRPCGSGASRITDFDKRASQTSTPDYKTTRGKLAASAFGSDIIINPFTIRTEDSKFFTSLIQIIGVSDKAASFSDMAAGSGRALVRVSYASTPLPPLEATSPSPRLNSRT